jgi:hypothetical protein
MEMQKFEFPEHLLEHNLSAQEQANIPADKLAIAKDWNILKRQNEWIIQRIVDICNVQQQHEDQLEFWKRIRWLVGGVCAMTTTIVAILKMIGYFK